MEQTAEINKNKIIALIDQVIFLGLIAFAFLLPVFINPKSSDPLETNKFFLLLFASLILFFLWSLKTILQKRVVLTLSAIDLPFLIFVLAVTISAVFSVYRLPSFLGEPGVYHLNVFETLAAFLLLLITATNLKTRKHITLVTLSLIIGITVASITEIFAQSGVLKVLNLGQGALFLTGSPFSAFLFSFIALILIGGLLIAVFKQKSWLKLIGLIFLGLINLAVFVYLASGFLPTNPLNAPFDAKPDLSTSWIVATSTLQKFPLFGSGPATYSIDFKAFKPAAYNLTALWNIAFSKGFNEFLTLIPSVGILGFLVFAWLFIQIGRYLIWEFVAKTKGEGLKGWGLNEGFGLGLLIMLISLLFTNFSISILGVFILLLGLWLSGKSLEGKHNIAGERVLTFAAIKDYFSDNLIHRADNQSNETAVETTQPAPRWEILPFVLGFFSFILLVGATWKYSQIYAADLNYQQGLSDLSNKDTQGSLKSLAQAVNSYPELSTYRSAIAQVFLADGQTLSQKKTLTDSEKNVIVSELNQAVNQIKLATESLNPLSASDWLTRAQIYQNLGGVLPQNANAQDPNVQNQLNALNSAVSAYNQAISLDPQNPQLYFDLGGLLYSQGDYANAEKYFVASVNLKPNDANARYNLAFTYKNENKLTNAQTELQNALLLLPPSGQDYKTVQKDLADVTKMITPTPTPTPTQPVEPQPAPTAQVSPTLPPVKPTAEPTKAPTPTSVIIPTGSPTTIPTTVPTAAPTTTPTTIPTP